MQNILWFYEYVVIIYNERRVHTCTTLLPFVTPTVDGAWKTPPIKIKIANILIAI